jgi:hypothetical protein
MPNTKRHTDHLSDDAVGDYIRNGWSQCDDCQCLAIDESDYGYHEKLNRHLCQACYEKRGCPPDIYDDPPPPLVAKTEEEVNNGITTCWDDQTPEQIFHGTMRRAQKIIDAFKPLLPGAITGELYVIGNLIADLKVFCEVNGHDWQDVESIFIMASSGIADANPATK